MLTLRTSSPCIYVAFMALLATTIVGCKTGGPGIAQSAAARSAMARPRTFVPTTGKAGVYLLYGANWALGDRTSMLHADLDGETFGMLCSEQYLYLEVPPGKHTLSARSMVAQGDTQFDATPGSNTFFMIVLDGKIILRQTSEEEGRKFIAQYSR